MGFKNCIDRWLGDIPDKPRDIGFEPEARDSDGKPSNSIKNWAKIINYDDSWVPNKKEGGKGKSGLIDTMNVSWFPT